MTPADQLGQRLRQHVDVLAEIIGPRHTGRPDALSATRDYLTQQLHEMNLSIERQAFEVFDREAVNLEIILPGSQPRAKTLVVGAHYDTVFSTPGADDNASAVAVLLEVLRELMPLKPRRMLRAVFYDCEEPPYFNMGDMGSAHHARACRQRGEELLGMICLESVGYYTDSPPPSDMLPPTLRPLQKLVGGRSIVAAANPASAGFLLRMLPSLWSWRGVPIRPVVAPRTLGVMNLSDHRSYWDEGYPAVMLTDTALLRNPHYHQASDRLATLDLTAMAKLTRQVTRTVRRLLG